MSYHIRNLFSKRYYFIGCLLPRSSGYYLNTRGAEFKGSDKNILAPDFCMKTHNLGPPVVAMLTTTPSTTTTSTTTMTTATTTTTTITSSNYGGDSGG